MKKESQQQNATPQQIAQWVRYIHSFMAQLNIAITEQARDFLDVLGSSNAGQQEKENARDELVKYLNGQIKPDLPATGIHSLISYVEGAYKDPISLETPPSPFDSALMDPKEPFELLLTKAGHIYIAKGLEKWLEIQMRNSGGEKALKDVYRTPLTPVDIHRIDCIKSKRGSFRVRLDEARQEYEDNKSSEFKYERDSGELTYQAIGSILEHEVQDFAQRQGLTLEEAGKILTRRYEEAESGIGKPDYLDEADNVEDEMLSQAVLRSLREVSPKAVRMEQEIRSLASVGVFKTSFRALDEKINTLEAEYSETLDEQTGEELQITKDKKRATELQQEEYERAYRFD